jgi:LPXTG-motif cell wall-anchored protein
VAASPAPRPARYIAASAAQPGVTQPKTPTDAELRLWLGLILLMAGLLLLAVRRQRHRHA